MNLPKLYDAMKRYYFSGLSPATRGCYKVGLKKYMEFCLQAHLPTIPTSERTLLLFATHLAKLNLSYPTIKVYMATVRSAHVTFGHPWNIRDTVHSSPRSTYEGDSEGQV